MAIKHAADHVRAACWQSRQSCVRSFGQSATNFRRRPCAASPRVLQPRRQRRCRSISVVGMMSPLQKKKEARQSSRSRGPCKRARQNSARPTPPIARARFDALLLSFKSPCGPRFAVSREAVTWTPARQLKMSPQSYLQEPHRAIAGAIQLSRGRRL